MCPKWSRPITVLCPGIWPEKQPFDCSFVKKCFINKPRREWSSTLGHVQHLCFSVCNCIYILPLPLPLTALNLLSNSWPLVPFWAADWREPAIPVAVLVSYRNQNAVVRIHSCSSTLGLTKRGCFQKTYFSRSCFPDMGLQLQQERLMPHM